jgi:hypothetical protein
MDIKYTQFYKVDVRALFAVRGELFLDVHCVPLCNCTQNPEYIRHEFLLHGQGHVVHASVG